ncbi:xanthine dehydrogenase family protein subunit M [Pseudonocardia aurantiaca]|uniref:FAD binding domain-containing protein n=1 Tax=Pseudonocardia aurantiaca TaxID=75290 RepID=A0ABW4G0S9_9PSEU
MKPAPFDYVAPTDLSDAVTALAERPETSRVLAGGQSLVLEMHYRRERPALLVDINNVRGLDAITVEGDALRVGALARHRAFETPSVAPGALGRLLSRVSPFIAHPPVRARGTMAGSLAWANPASEWCATAVALDAAIELTGPVGSRTVAGGDFFLGPFHTARQPDEILTSVRLPLLPGPGPGPGAEADAVGVGFCEQHRTHASFAQVAVVAVLTVRDSVITGARLGLAGAADRPVCAHEAERHLVGREAAPAVFARAAELTVAAAAPLPEPHAGVEYKRHAVGVLIRRALAQAREDREINGER